ncbi:MAG TPA: addiction module protein [Planctomycetota bacterium]|nr:addiction module protein [Planctomycetota bacterium]
MTTKQLEQEALRKSPQERERLAYRLFHSVEPGDDAVLTPELIAMLERASKEAEEHPETLTTLDEVERELDEELKNSSLP